MNRSSFSLITPRMVARFCLAGMWAGSLSAGVVLNDDFSSYLIGNEPTAEALGGAVVIDGSATIGSGQALQVTDSDTGDYSAYEVNFASGVGSQYSSIGIEFDFYNDDATNQVSYPVFGVGNYSEVTYPILNATASRAFNLEFRDNDRIYGRTQSEGNLGYAVYDTTASNHISIFINDSSSAPLTYTRPDTMASDTLAADSFAVFVDDVFWEVNSINSASSDDYTNGEASLGRLGFYTSSGALGQFTIDNLVVSDLSAVPEPSTYVLLAGFGVLGFGWIRRRLRARMHAEQN